MTVKYSGMAASIYAAQEKVTTIYLSCSNPISQEEFDLNEFPPNEWIDPCFVAADSTILAYYCSITKRWVNTKAKVTWIDQSAIPKHGLLEIKPQIESFLVFLG